MIVNAMTERRRAVDAQLDTSVAEMRREAHDREAEIRMAQTLIQRNPGRIRLPLRARDENPPGEVHNIQWRSVDEEARGVAEFIAHKVSEGTARPSMR